MQARIRRAICSGDNNAADHIFCNSQLATLSRFPIINSQLPNLSYHPQIQSQYPFVLNIPMAQLWRGLIPYTAHPGFGDGAPNVHTYARASWCPAEGTARAHLPTLFRALSSQLPVSNSRIPSISSQLNSIFRIRSLEAKATKSMFKLEC